MGTRDLEDETEPDGVAIGRINPRRITRDEFLAIQPTQKSGRPGPKPCEIDVVPRLRVNAVQLKQAKTYAERRDVSVADALVTLGFVPEDTVIGLEAELTASRWISAQELTQVTDMQARDSLPTASCRELQVFPVALEDDALAIAMRDPFDTELLKKVAAAAGGLKTIGIRAGLAAINQALDRGDLTSVNPDDPSTWLER